MKPLRASLLFLLGLVALPGVGQRLGSESVSLVDWQFSKDSVQWTAVSVPHSYNALDGVTAKYYRGKGYYRRSIHLTAGDADRPLYLLFEGAAQQAWVYVNGQLLTHHRGGYTPFVLDVSNLLHEGDNLVAVTCDNHEDVSLIPVSSDFNKNGGLHNPVFLLKMSPIYVSPLSSGLYRLHVTVPQVSAQKATTVMSAELRNASGKTERVSVDYLLKDASGHTAYQHTDRLLLSATPGAATSLSHSFTLPRPHLWNGVDDPYLYSASIVVKDLSGKVMDEVSTKVGYRYYKVTRDAGFFLNGRHYALRGVAEHQDIAGKASAVSLPDIESDYRIIAELGCNFLRLAHYPHNDREYQLCDSLGIIVQTEIPWVNVCGVKAQPSYFENIHSQMREMVTNLYNHPSIMFWGMWNEIDYWGNVAGQLQDKLDPQRVVSETARLYDYTKKLDPYRLCGPTDCSLYRNPGYAQLKGDYHSENRYVGWYYQKDNFAHFTNEMNEIHQRMGAVNLSEYGAGINPWCHTWSTDLKYLRGDDKVHFEEFGNLVHESHVRQMVKMPFLNFTSAWVLFDFPVAARQEGFMDSSDGIYFKENDGRKFMNDKGLVTRDRKLKKDIFYLYKSLWNHKVKTVYITSRRRTRIDSATPCVVKVYSNARSLQLFVDGRLTEEIAHCPDVSGVIWQFKPIVLTEGNHELKVIGDGVTDSVRLQAVKNL